MNQCRYSRRGRWLIQVVALGLAACQPDAPPDDADVIVVGAGIAGLSAALEAGSAGASVVVLDINSVGGGHAVRAGGFALVGTPLQEAKGHQDDPDTAFRDLMSWGEDADPDWVRRYVEQSRSEVHDWLAGFGVSFAILLDTPEDTVPRFHFTRGAAVNAVVPMLREAVARESIGLRWHTAAEGLLIEDGRVVGIVARDTRSGMAFQLRAPVTVLATGGFQSNVDLVRSTWREDKRLPETLLIGSGQFAKGDGIRLGESAGAKMNRIRDQVTFVHGLPNPRDPSGATGILTQNPAAIAVNARGRRFYNEAAFSKDIETAVLAQDPPVHWLIFDDKGRRRLRIRGNAWLSRQAIATQLLGNPELVQQAESIAALAAAAGLPAAALQTTVARYNEFVARGIDEDFDRFSADSEASVAVPIAEAPFFAIKLYPLTRKSLGGLAINPDAAVVGQSGQPIPGLFAAGEVTGVAGINGRYGGSGTFLGPSVLIGRIAGRSAAGQALGKRAMGSRDPPRAPNFESPSQDPGSSEQPGGDPATMPMLSAAELAVMLEQDRPGYWHFETSHRLVLERDYDCAECHSAEWPTGPAITVAQQLLELESCTNCH
jgi:succinate dehydrogenase/fumarate reductase flavoprotein subunit